MTSPTLERTVVSDDMLKTFHERAPGYDKNNSFFTEDFEDLRSAGYLKYCIPTEAGS